LRRVGLDEGDTLGDVLLEVCQASLEEFLLVGIDGADGKDLLNTIGAELDLGGEEVDALVLVERAINERRLDDTLLALGGTEDGVGHASTGHGHGEGGRTGTVLSLDNLVTTKLDTVDELSVGGQVGVVALTEKRDDGDTRVATNDGDLLVSGVGTLDLADEAAGTDDIEGGDTEETLGVVDTTGLVDLGADGDGRVDGVGNDEQVGLGARLGAGLGEVADDGSVGVEEIVTGHTGLAGDTGGDDDDVAALESGGEARGAGLVTLDRALGVDMGDIGSNTGSSTDIIESEFSNSRIELQQKRQRLADTTSSTENGDLGELQRPKDGTK
jgi:hypothetical protein